SPAGRAPEAAAHSQPRRQKATPAALWANAWTRKAAPCAAPTAASCASRPATQGALRPGQARGAGRSYSADELGDHISQLHEYKDIKDIGQMLLGKLAVLLLE
ncbi:PREDICTED: DNA repair protein SWI5 homolog, partial [Galeopterus variegatus]|uniref:DNA repair protein SWI5 homolog n=1 Tax=Galeopterus variegatus TaxID=482537 RepID=A0ABM0Q1A5_GALVR